MVKAFNTVMAATLAAPEFGGVIQLAYGQGLGTGIGLRLARARPQTWSRGRASQVRDGLSEARAGIEACGLGIDFDQCGNYSVDVRAERPPLWQQVRGRVSQLDVAEVSRVGEEGMVASASLREAERGVQPAECG